LKRSASLDWFMRALFLFFFLPRVLSYNSYTVRLLLLLRTAPSVSISKVNVLCKSIVVMVVIVHTLLASCINALKAPKHKCLRTPCGDQAPICNSPVSCAIIGSAEFLLFDLGCHSPLCDCLGTMTRGPCVIGSAI